MEYLRVALPTRSVEVEITFSTAAFGSCGCHNENNFPTCDGCTINNWCVLRDGNGNMISYTDRTAVSDGLANSDCCVYGPTLSYT